MNSNQINNTYSNQDWEMCLSILINPNFTVENKQDKVIDTYFNKFDEDFKMMTEEEFNEFLNENIEYNDNSNMEDINNIFEKYLN